MTYKLYKTISLKAEADAVLLTHEDGSMTSFLFDKNNPDYQAYLKWLEEGNTPLPDNEQN